MKKNIQITVITLIAVFICVHASMAQPESELKEISLIYSDHSPPDTGGALFLKQEYLPKVNKELARIGYELKITFYHNGSLYKFSDQICPCQPH